LRDSEPAAFRFRQLSIVNCQSTSASGFTLLELMISFTIIGLILVLVFGSLRIGARAWEKGERDIESHQRQRVVLDNLRRQIASICPHKIKVDGDKGQTSKKIFFRGDSEGMAFMTRLPMSPMTRSGMVYAKYVVRQDDGVEKRRLLIYERDAVFIHSEEDLDEVADDEFFELIPEAEAIEFAYLKRPEDKDAEPEWKDGWDPESDAGIPLAVKITFQEDEDASPIHVIVRVQAEASQK